MLQNDSPSDINRRTDAARHSGDAGTGRLKQPWRNRLKRIFIFALIITAVAVIAPQLNSFAQQKKRPVRRATPTPTPALDMRQDAAKVAEQIKNVSNFIYVYGKIVNTLEVADDQAKNKQSSPEIQAKNQKSKDQLVATISGLRAGLENVAKGFQANPRMQVQSLKISNATEAATNAERLAAAGRYDDAGKMLVAVIDRLTDTLISMRLQ
jgi:hypothetical protein